MKYLENLKDFGIGLILFISGVALLVQFVHWLVGLFL
jgi:hypothetical protein